MSQRGVNAVRSRRAARSRGKSGALINRGYRSDPPGIKQESGLSSPAMPFISGKQAFLQILKQEGVSVMFGNPGTTELPLMDGLAREPGIHYVLALQEAAAIAMTDGYAQASGGLGAVNVHVSPGLGNAMGMLYDAYKAGTPMLLTAGQHDQCFTVTEPILWSELPPVAQPYVKWSTEARRLEDLPRIVRRARHRARRLHAGGAADRRRPEGDRRSGQEAGAGRAAAAGRRRRRRSLERAGRAGRAGRAAGRARGHRGRGIHVQLPV